MLTSARFRVARAATLFAGAAIALGFSLPADAARTDTRAADSQGATTQAPRAAASDPDRMICVRARLTGSRLHRRICRTERQWLEDGEVPYAR